MSPPTKPRIIATAAVVVVVVVVGAVACSSVLRMGPRATRTVVAGPNAADPKNAAAVVLYRETRHLLLNPYGARGVSEHQYSQAVKVLSEEGFAAASAHVVVGTKGELVSMEARTIAADGTIHAVDPAAVLSDDFKWEENSGQTRSFQFPRVEVGSVLEHSYVVRYPHVQWSLRDEPVGEWPVLVYDVEIVLDPYAQPDFLLQNLTAPLGFSKDGGAQRITLHLENLPMASGEPRRPPARETDPWWIYRTVEWRYPTLRWAGLTNWGRALGHVYGDLVVKKKGLDDVYLDKRERAHCGGDDDCLVAAALVHVRDFEFTEFDGDDFDLRPLSEVLATRNGNNHERAVLLWALLNDAGIEARLAVLATQDAAAVMRDLPSQTWLNHTIVKVPATTTAPALWLDPSCPHCAPGELPWWTHGTQAVVLEPKDQAASNHQELGGSAFEAVVGRPAAPDEHRTEIEVVVDKAGDVVVTCREEARSTDAIEHALEHRTDDAEKRKKAAEDAARKISASAIVEAASPWTYDPLRGVIRTETRARLPGYGTVDDDGTLLVPVPIRVDYDAWPDRHEPRIHAVVFSHDEISVQTVRIVPPPGHRAECALQPLHQATAGFDVDVTVTHDGPVLVITRRYHEHRGRFDKRHWKDVQAVAAAGSAVQTAVARIVQLEAAAN